MSIYIKGMEMPKADNWKTVRIYPDGTCAVPNWQGDCTLIKGAQAIPVPVHGDLIDRSGVDVLSWKEDEQGKDFADGVLFVMDKLDELPVIIPAEGEDYT